MQRQISLSEIVRNENYKRLEPSNLSEAQWAVYKVFENSYPNPIPDKKIVEALGWPVNCVTPRRGELVNIGLIEEAGVDFFPDHNGKMRANTLWRLA